MGKGITMTIVFQAQSLNYGEGVSNISELKKLTRMDGNQYTFVSRQAIRFDIVRLGHEIFDWNLQVVDKSKGTVQFKEDATIKDSVEMDLFGYMKTSKKDEENKGGSLVRPAVVRLSNAISLEPYRSDMDFLSNKGLADRIGEHPNLANSEQHMSFYTYTVTIDLDRIGVDNEISLEKTERANRILQLLDIIKILNRNIRGRQENLSPLFIIGGLYKIPNPFFLGRVKLENRNGKYSINENIIKDTLELTFGDKEIKDDTYIGIVDGIFTNKEEFEKILPDKVVNVEKFFEILKEKVKAYYGV